MSQSTLSGHKHRRLTQSHLALSWPRSHLEKPFEHPDTRIERVGLPYYLQINSPACKAQTPLRGALNTRNPYHLHRPCSFICHPAHKAMLAMRMPSASSRIPLTDLCKPGLPFLQNATDLIHDDSHVLFSICNFISHKSQFTIISSSFFFFFLSFFFYVDGNALYQYYCSCKLRGPHPTGLAFDIIKSFCNGGRFSY